MVMVSCGVPGARVLQRYRDQGVWGVYCLHVPLFHYFTLMILLLLLSFIILNIEYKRGSVVWNNV